MTVRDSTGLASRSPYPGSEHVRFVQQSMAPDALEALLVDLHERFPELPLFVTGGVAVDDELVDGEVHDPRRIDYLHQHLVAAHRAVARGVEVRGYLVRSLLDGFEWTNGYTERFGIVHVDFETFARTVKDSGRWVARLVGSRVLPEQREA